MKARPNESGRIFADRTILAKIATDFIMPGIELSIVIAVYNEEEVLGELYNRLTAALVKLGRTYEVILVDDGSRDRSLELMLELRHRDPSHIRVLSFSRNFGHHVALTAGLDHAGGEILIMMDADLQDQPEEIHKLLAKLDEGYDVVWGERVARQFKWYKNITSAIFLRLMNGLARSEVQLDSSIFRAMRKKVADDLRGLREKARYLPGLVRWLGYRQTSIPVEHGKRFAGHTKYSFWRLVKLALSTATSFSAAPLQFATLSGMAAAGVAVMLGIYVIVRKLIGGYAVQGYASLMLAIFAFGALELIVIGLMGEYISRIYGESQGRPLYVLQDLPEGSASVGQIVLTADSHSPRPQKLSEFSKAEQAELQTSVASDPHLPLANVYQTGSASKLAAMYLQDWAKSDPYVFTHRLNGVLRAAIVYQDLEFDTKLLGINAGRLLYANSFADPADQSKLWKTDPMRIAALDGALQNLHRFTDSRSVKLIDARISNQDLFVSRSFESANYHLVDSLVTLGAPKEKIEAILSKLAPKDTFSWEGDQIRFSDNLIVRPMVHEDEASLAELSELSFADHSMIQDRFFLEPAIDADRAQSLFRVWFENLAKKHHEQRGIVLVAEFNGQIAGYLALETLSPFDGASWWKDTLNAVVPEARGRGIYRALVVATLASAQKNGAAGVMMKTQASTYRVINTWLHLGCDIMESFATLHRVNNA